MEIQAPDPGQGGPYKSTAQVAQAEHTGKVWPKDAGRWESFKADVIGPRASVQPFAGWLLTALLCFVVYLTLVFAPGAFERSKLPDGADPSGVITLEMGYWTIGVVSLVALLVGFEPYIRRILTERTWVSSSGSTVKRIASGIWHIPSVILSTCDTILARVVAIAVGATQRGTLVRYCWGLTILFGAAIGGLLLPPPFGLAAVTLGIVGVLAIVRRWNWIEADRDTFLVERGAARSGSLRIGFVEDLRDEALVAIIFLFALIPILLRQIQIATCAAGGCAFALEGGALPPDTLGQFIAWLGYFGAELAKAVPFVDWSEVFQVANNSPIKPKTTFGAQVVFVMRAILDLLLLAAVVQAVGIAGRLREQDTAFRNNRLPILEPFAESRELRRAALAIETALDAPPSQQNPITSFPVYDEDRLKEIVAQDDGAIDPLARKAAAAILAHQYPGISTFDFFTLRSRTDAIDGMREWIAEVATGTPTARTQISTHERRQRLLTLFKSRTASAEMRCAAARNLGRLPNDSSVSAALFECVANLTDNAEVRVASAVALTKLDIRTLGAAPERLAALFKGPPTTGQCTAIISCAYAIARTNPGSTPKEIAALFDGPHREAAVIGAGLQLAPMAIDVARASELGSSSNQLVRIDPNVLGSSFLLGAEETESEAFPQDGPPTSTLLSSGFAIGRFAVTREEYRAFVTLTGRKWSPSFGFIGRFPATDVSWADAQSYCQWLEQITGNDYRLPSEVEWEYACRAGTTTRFWWGDVWDQKMAHTNATGGTESPKDVNSYSPNPWGLWGMTGNVFEWCADPWHENHEGRPQGSGVWINQAEYGNRVVRGGSWLQAPRYARSAARRARSIDLHDHYIGFRLAMSISEPESGK